MYTGAAIPSGPLSSQERDRIVALEHQVDEARQAQRQATSEQARLTSRLELAQDESNILAQRLLLANASLADKEAERASKQAELESHNDAKALSATAAAAAQHIDTHPSADVTAAISDALLLATELAGLKQERDSLVLGTEEQDRNLRSLAQELEEAHEAAQTQAQRAAHDLDLAKKIAHDRQVAIDMLHTQRAHILEWANTSCGGHPYRKKKICQLFIITVSVSLSFVDCLCPLLFLAPASAMCFVFLG